MVEHRHPWNSVEFSAGLPVAVQSCTFTEVVFDASTKRQMANVA